MKKHILQEIDHLNESQLFRRINLHTDVSRILLIFQHKNDQP